MCLAAGILAATLTACGSTHWGFPYRATVQQGNWITTEQIAQLQVGMTRDQVRFILGSPTLQDALHANRWDYPYYNQPGYGKDELRHFTVWFENDQLTRWAGDPQPDRQPFQKADTGKEAITDQATEAQAAQAATPTGDDAALPQAFSAGTQPDSQIQTQSDEQRNTQSGTDSGTDTGADTPPKE
ncbi:MAG TPA: outer membrane protein assembly factor BamE [Castellaniella sp.]|nr:outer membrane protein assembly factor BamE [Castellaniella sp.]